MTNLDVTQDLLIVSVVVLTAALIVLVFISIYRGQRRCNKRIDIQAGAIEKIDGRVDLINSEINDIKIKQAVAEATAVATAAANAASEKRFRPETQVQSPVYTAPPPSPAQPPVQFITQPPVQLIQTQPAPAPVQVIQPQPVVQPIVQPVMPPVQYVQVQPEPQPASQPAPQYVHPAQKPQPPARPPERQPSAVDLIYSHLTENQDFGRPSDYSRPKAAPLTEYRLPDYDDVCYSSQRNVPEQPQEYKYQKEPQLPGKYRSLHDNVSRTGRVYSEEELYNKILE